MSRNNSPLSVTRTGIVHSPIAKFGHEERFNWQRPQFVSDVVYQLPDTKDKKGTTFGTSTRVGMDEENKDAKKRSTGPGSYHVDKCYQMHSEYLSRPSYRFGGAPRQSMDLKTPSPGAVYNIENVFRHGKLNTTGIGFNCDTRKPLHNSSAATNADILWPKLPQGPAVTIAKKLKIKNLGHDTPGAIYDVHKKVDFKTGPSYSFGKSRSSRFKGEGGMDLTLGPIA